MKPISEEEYKSALNLVDAYKIQTNADLIRKGFVDESDFNSLIPVKHRADLNVDDLVFLAIDPQDKKRGFELVVCTGFCGRDEFWGSLSGRERVWCSGDTFKIVGTHINIQSK